jgi:exodeoxyribonuclease-5
MSFEEGAPSRDGSGDGDDRRKGHVGRPHFSVEDLHKQAARERKEAERAAARAGGTGIESGLPVVAPAPSTGITRDSLSPDQVVVYDKVVTWLQDKGRRQYLKLGGLAGTGKSTLVAVLATEMQKRDMTVAFGAYTGKAANVLGRKLRAAGIKAPCSTLHSLMYGPVLHDHEGTSAGCRGGKKCVKLGRIESWAKHEEIEAGLVVVDEASMVNSEIWKDLLSYNVPILAVGDHGQLPPISRDSVNLMESPDLRLEKIHRQAAGNPILAFAHHVRERGDVRGFVPSDDRVTFKAGFMGVLEEFLASVHVKAQTAAPGPFELPPYYATLLNTAVICAKNNTRVTINKLARRCLAYEGDAPDPGDVVICLKNFKPIFNGMRGIFEGADYAYEANDYGAFTGTVFFPDDGKRVRGDINYMQFGREKTFEHPRDVPHVPTVEAAEKWNDTGLLFDYGYALTCHKAQGSQFADVIVCAYDAFGNTDMRRRWLYTAATRAAERLIVVR